MKAGAGSFNKCVSFRYYFNDDRMEYQDDIASVIPCTSVVVPFLENLEMGAKVCPDDVRRAIDLFSQAGILTEPAFSYIRFMDISGNFKWFQIKIDNADCKINLDI